MSTDLYLSVVTSNGTTLASNTGVSVRNPFRGDPGAGGVTVVNPLRVSSYEFSVDAAPPTTGGGGAGKPVASELRLTLPADPNTASLLLTICKGVQLNSADLLVVRSGPDQPAVLKPFTGFGYALAFVTEVGWQGSAGDEEAGVTLALVARQLSTGWSPLRAGGSYGPFTFSTWDFLRGVQV